MEKMEREGKKYGNPEITEADIDGFIEKCDREGKNPLDVVKFLADSNGINVMSELGPDDVTKRRVFNLLKGVVKKVIIGFLSYCADNYGLGFIQSLMGSCGSCRDIEKSSKSSEKVADASVSVSPVLVRLIPVRVGTW
jgi:hypothetical protein